MAWRISVPRTRALMVDDDPRLLNSTQTRIGREISWEVDWSSATTLTRLSAHRAIGASLRPRDRGLDVPAGGFPGSAGTTRARSDPGSQPPVLATFYSGRSASAPSISDLMDQARQLGAHHVLRRIEFSTVSTLHTVWAAIAADIQSHLLDNGRSRTPARSELNRTTQGFRAYSIRSARPPWPGCTPRSWNLAGTKRSGSTFAS